MDWIEIYATHNEYEAMILEEYLKDNEIETVIINNKDSMYKFGDYKIMIQASNALKAKIKLEEYLKSL